MAWMSSPSPGTITTQVVWAVLTISTSSWPTPTVSMMTMSMPRASMTNATSEVERDNPPRAPRVARLRMNTPSSQECRFMRMRSPRMAPPVKGLVGSMATTPTFFPLARNEAVTWSTRVDLPAPGGPVMPMM